MNARFKSGLMKLCGNYTPDALQRIAKSLEITSSLEEKLYPHYIDRFVKCLKVGMHDHYICCSEEPLIKDRLGHRTGDWSEQVHRGVQELCVSSKLMKYSLTGDYFCPAIPYIFLQDANVFIYTAGRDMPGAPEYARKDKVDFKV